MEPVPAPGELGGLRAAFIMEQAVGHSVQAQHLLREVREVPGLDARYVPVTSFVEGGWIERAGLVPAAIRASLRARQQVRSGLADFQPEVILWNTQKPAAFCQGLLKIPSVISMDDTPNLFNTMASDYGQSTDPDLLEAMKYRLNRRIFGRARKLLPATRWAAQSLVNDYGVDSSRVEVLAPGTDLCRFRPPEGRPSETDGVVRVLFVGGEFRRKGGDTVVEWFTSTAPDNVELHLVTREAVPPHPRISMHRFEHTDSGLSDLYRRADIFVLPTRAECFGLVLTEAMASGLPCVTTPVGGVPEVVDDGVSGVHVPPGDVRALSEAMTALIDNASLRLEMGANGRRVAERRFDSRKNVGRIVQVLREAVEESKSDSLSRSAGLT